ncbi:MAG: M28 family peptidase, partial [Planctomycetes bacterium]|nr:M28 family peptidase [Planctomycetota bacterium]
MSQALVHKAAGVLVVNDPYSGKSATEKRKTELNQAAEKIADLAEQFVAIDASNAEKLTEGRNSLVAAVNQRKSLKEAHTSPNDDPLMSFGYAGHGENTSLPPAFHITQKLANKMLASVSRKLESLETDIDAELKPQSMVVEGWKVRGTVSMERVKTEIYNVVGVIDGEGPLAEETIVIGAHYDHVGRGGMNSLAPGSMDIHNGADDNASGTVSLIELARRFGAAAQQKKPERRLVFIAFTGEEIGLLGSAHYCREPL